MHIIRFYKWVENFNTESLKMILFIPSFRLYCEL